MTDFKVGDRVRLTGSEWGHGESPKIGDEYEIAGVSDYGAFFEEDGEKWRIYKNSPERWGAELVTEISTEPKTGATFSLTVTGGVEWQDRAGLSGEEMGRRVAQLTEWFPYAQFNIETEATS